MGVFETYDDASHFLFSVTGVQTEVCLWIDEGTEYSQDYLWCSLSLNIGPLSFVVMINDLDYHMSFILLLYYMETIQV